MALPAKLRNPVLWLVVGLPVLSIVAGVGLVMIALRSGGDDAVIDTVQRTAQIQTTELGPDERAQAIKLSAVLHVDAKGIELLPVGEGFSNGAVPRDAPLSLVLSHPSDAQLDRRVELKPSELGWHADVDLPQDHDWLLHLAPSDTGWRLRGRLIAGQGAAHLAPAVGGR
ncbi:FixH family protein [Lysobacter arvi]|uniref:FixH family protein n=1 Tax=Lysobacter arvi TaxID=3038776 RepID=A0ABU1CFK7_9GAMM|nr:FixH family protein [Lysobacter arvi]MDR0183732.1 FixH family protein [Lysobacter arvi]